MALPSTKRVRDLLQAQLRREVRLEPGAPPAATVHGLAYGIYVDTHLATRAIAVVDLPAAAFLGAATGLVPVGVATAAVRAHRLPPLIAGHLAGLLAGWARLFGSDAPASGDEVRLYHSVLPGERPPADVAALAAAPGRRLDLAVDVRAYGQGRLSLVMGR